MQSPMIVFDHINKTLITTGPGEVMDPRTAELLAAARDQVTTASGVPQKS